MGIIKIIKKKIGVPEDNNLCLQQIGGGIWEKEGLIREKK